MSYNFWMVSSKPTLSWTNLRMRIEIKRSLSILISSTGCSLRRMESHTLNNISRPRKSRMKDLRQSKHPLVIRNLDQERRGSIQLYLWTCKEIFLCHHCTTKREAKERCKVWSKSKISWYLARFLSNQELKSFRRSCKSIKNNNSKCFNKHKWTEIVLYRLWLLTVRHRTLIL